MHFFVASVCINCDSFGLVIVLLSARPNLCVIFVSGALYSLLEDILSCMCNCCAVLHYYYSSLWPCIC